MILPQSGSATAWLANYASSATIISAHANIMTNGVVVADFPLESGSVTLDRTAAVRRTCSLVFTPSMGISAAKALFGQQHRDVRRERRIARRQHHVREARRQRQARERRAVRREAAFV